MPRFINTSIEKQRLKYLINNPTLVIEKFSECGKHVLRLIEKGGRTHHDLEYIDIYGEKNNIEVKGFCGNKKSVDGAPWINWSPQYLNEGMKYNIDKLFAKKWYENSIPEIKKYFNINCNVPTLEEWLKLDANHQGSARSDWGVLLKKIYKENKYNIEYIKNLHYKKLDITLNNLSQEQKDEFIFTLEKRSNNALKDKQWWVGIKYEKTDSIEPLEISLVEGPTIINLKFKEIKMKTKGPVIITSYSTTINPNTIYEGEARLRFRNTTGVANIGWGIK